MIEWIVVHHDAGPAPPDSVEAEREYVHRVTEYHIEGRRWPGNGYHGMVMPSGRVWVSAPADRATYHCGVEDGTPGAIVGVDENEISLALSFAGDYREFLPSTRALESAKRWIEAWRAGLSNFRGVVGHRGVPGAQTECPGGPLERWLQDEFGYGETPEEIRAALLAAAGKVKAITEIQVAGKPLLDWAEGG